jgi:hypothetical protein
MIKSNYSFNIVDNQLKIIDNWSTGYMSVTNNIENVLNEIRNQIGDNIENLNIVYRDTDGNWDSVNPEWRNQECVNVIFF